jgi:uncharacterized protein YecT (DUF1311 family)
MMKLLQVGILAIVFLAASEAVISNDSGERDCNSTTQSTLSFCAKEAHQRADSELNATYAKLVAQLKTDASKGRLKEAQRAWMHFRDKDCNYYNSGAELRAQYMSTMMYFFCLTDRTKTRTKELESFLGCTQGGCPH